LGFFCALFSPFCVSNLPFERFALPWFGPFASWKREKEKEQGKQQWIMMVGLGGPKLGTLVGGLALPS
jgi:hypothetical protein